MAKFNEYGFQASNDNGVSIVHDGRVTAIGLEQAWHKAIAAAFEAVEPGTGDQPAELYVYRISKASEHHG